jgi:beta-galactosidase
MYNLDKNKNVQDFNQGWYIRPGMYDAISALQGNKGRCVNLPHDYMIEQDVEENAPSGPAMGFYNGKIANYTKNAVIPSEWKSGEVILHFDGVMMNSTINVNGSRAALHHYGYTPFDVDITPYIYWGEENRITVTCNPSMQPNSRWYTGAGIYRHVTIENRPLLHIATDGIFAYTADLDGAAHIVSEVTVENHTGEGRLVEVEVLLTPETFTGESVTRTGSAFVKAGSSTTVRIPVTVSQPVLWDADNPELYTITANMKDEGVFGVNLNKSGTNPMTDSKSTLFGIRTIKADSARGLQINGNEIKLKGGCIHHDNGILGAISLYDSEYRKLKIMKNIGYNAVRTAHNPPSKELLEACDRVGMYVFNEAFDCWGMAKQPGDYSQYFDTDWKNDMKSFIKRDRNHPSVIIWSTGNEIVERGGLGNGYELAGKLADYMRSLDGTRLVTNALCSYWSGLDDKTNIESTKEFLEAMSGEATQMQNASVEGPDTSWEDRSEAFANALDIVGYNYMDSHYRMDGEMYPERVIIGTESYPDKMHEVWSLVEKFPFVAGDFTWTSIDYIGEAGIGRSLFAEADDPAYKAGPFSLMSQSAKFPWRLANDADIDITGNILPQGAMRKLLWGGKDTSIFVHDPKNYGKKELISMWGWPDLEANWNWKKNAGKPIEVIVYSPGDTVKLYLNDDYLGSAEVIKNTAQFNTVYQPGTLKAVSIKNDEIISEGALVTSAEAAGIRLTPDKDKINADGDSLSFVKVELVDKDGRIVKDEDTILNAKVTGNGSLAGFGSANPITEENYTLGRFTTYRGAALAIIRSCCEAGEIVLTVNSDKAEQTLKIQSIK